MAEEIRVQQMDEPQDWVKKLRGADKLAYDEVREESIGEIAEVYKQRLKEFVDEITEIGAEEAIAHRATRLATNTRDSFEAGIQVGMDSEREYRQQLARREREEHASFQRNVIGNWAG